ncbi:hypothetical protein IFM89_010247 [Coptis chinensis]|uniref:Protein arginine N-methyltransferase domain-containing protein n=1 Tax=Coptis chinensis TaxID=261450 RepID=A0A835ICB6_9MAGN|nr:hypothetical protein IFM89_010247 [Coptis chinensis]
MRVKGKRMKKKVMREKKKGDNEGENEVESCKVVGRKNNKREDEDSNSETEEELNTTKKRRTLRNKNYELQLKDDGETYKFLEDGYGREESVKEKEKTVAKNLEKKVDIVHVGFGIVVLKENHKTQDKQGNNMHKKATCFSGMKYKCAGTGLLSMMAARTMAESSSEKGTVSACESYLPMFKLMRKVLHFNGMQKNVHIFNKRSDELQLGVDIASRADVLVSEILDSELLGEGLIPTLQNAHDKLLVENPLTVPYRATTYGQSSRSVGLPTYAESLKSVRTAGSPCNTRIIVSSLVLLVESKYLWKLHDIHNNEAQTMDGVHLAPVGLETVLHVKPQQYAMHCDAILEEIRLLSEPFKMFEFDFWKRPDSRGETEVYVSTIAEGRVHAVISWWVLQLDFEGTVFYSTAPRWISSPFNTSNADWCDHWKQCVWFVPGMGVPVLQHEQVHLQASHDDISFSYNLQNHNLRTESAHYELYSGGYQLTLSPERIAVYGDKEWRYTVFTATRDAAKVCRVCVVADDSVFLTVLVAHLSTSSRVISLFPGLQEKGAKYLQSIANANGFSMDRVKVLGNNRIHRTCLTMNDTNGEKVTFIVFKFFTDVCFAFSKNLCRSQFERNGMVTEVFLSSGYEETWFPNSELQKSF